LKETGKRVDWTGGKKGKKKIAAFTNWAGGSSIKSGGGRQDEGRGRKQQQSNKKLLQLWKEVNTFFLLRSPPKVGTGFAENLKNRQNSFFENVKPETGKRIGFPDFSAGFTSFWPMFGSTLLCYKN
jgi:hypothetical protein